MGKPAVTQSERYPVTGLFGALDGVHQVVRINVTCSFTVETADGRCI
jgi:hypothetical protein